MHSSMQPFMCNFSISNQQPSRAADDDFGIVITTISREKKKPRNFQSRKTKTPISKQSSPNRKVEKSEHDNNKIPISF